MGPGVVGRRPLSMALGSRRVILLSSKFWSSPTTSCAANPPTKSKTNCPWVSRRSQTVACSAGKTMLVSLEGCSEKKIGGPNRTVEVDESRFGRREYHRGHPVQGLWVFGGVERGSGRLFLVSVPDRTADTLEAIIHDRIEPATTVILDCWDAYRDLDLLGYTDRTVNHSLYFAHPYTGDHTNTIESTWHRVKVFLGPYNRREDYHYHLAHCMFAARCKAQGISPFLQFLHLVANTHWSNVDVPSSSGPAT